MNSLLVNLGKYLIVAVKVFVGFTSEAAMAERLFSNFNWNDLCGDQLRSAMRFPPP